MSGIQVAHTADNVPLGKEMIFTFKDSRILGKGNSRNKFEQKKKTWDSSLSLKKKKKKKNLKCVFFHRFWGSYMYHMLAQKFR